MESEKHSGSRLIPLTNGHVAIVDAADYKKVAKFKWYAKKAADDEVYAARSVRYGKQVKTILLHRFIMDCPVGKEVDHKNCDRLDNRRANVEIVTRAENMQRRWKR